MTHSHVSLLLLHYPLPGSREFMLSQRSHLSSIYYHQALDKYQGDKKALMEEIHRESLVDEDEEFDDEINASACQGSDKHSQRALEVNGFQKTISSMVSLLSLSEATSSCEYKIKDFEPQHQVSFVIIKASAHYMDSDEWSASPQAMLALTSLRKVTEMHNFSKEIGAVLKANRAVNGVLLKRKRDETGKRLVEHLNLN